MTMRQAPPGRTSSWQSGLVKPCGPHHWAMCVGSVQALKTRSRGASKMRVMTTSRSARLVSSLLLAAMFLLLGLNLTEIIVEAIQTLLPETAIVRDPVGDVLERPGLKSAGAPLGLPTPGDKAGPLQHLEVL